MKLSRIGGFAMLCIVVLCASACATDRAAETSRRGRKPIAALSARSESDAIRARVSAEKARDEATDAGAERNAKALFDNALDLLIEGYDSLDADDAVSAASLFDQADKAFEESRRATLAITR